MLAPKNVRTVFSILNEKDAALAREAFYAHYVPNARAFTDSIRWLDLDEEGHILRAGQTLVLDRTDTLITDPNRDDELRLIIESLASQSHKPGNIISLLDQDAFVWLLPFAQAIGRNPARAKTKALYVTFPLVSDTLGHFNEEAKLSLAERRVIFYLMMGLSLRQAAECDGVSFETKRSQCKSACLKLGCGSQSDLIRLSLGQLVHLFNLSGGDSEDAQVAEDFVADFCPASTRMKLHRLSDGRALRILECGPVEGRPVLLFHSMTFAPLLTGAVSELRRHNLRLIVPIRPGFLESANVAHPIDKQALERFCHDVEHYLALTRSESQVVIGHGFSNCLAMHFATLHPARVSHIALMSVQVRARALDSASVRQRFFRSFNELAISPEVFRRLSREFRRRYATPSAMRYALQRLFRESQADLSALEGFEARAPAYPALQAVFQSSHLGIADDFYVFYKGILPSTLDGGHVPLLCLQGGEDNANPPAMVNDMIVPERGDRLHVLEGAGHLCFVSHAEEVWAQIRDWITS